MKKLLALLLALAAVTTLQATAHAQVGTDPRPLLSLERLSIGARAEYDWWDGRGQEAPASIAFKKEFGAGISASYQMVSSIRPDGSRDALMSLTWRTVYFVDNRFFNHALGVNFQIYNGRK